MESLKLVLTHFSQETMFVVIGLLIFVLTVIIFYWLYNRKKFHELSHQIPASVVKNYLDSIIQNSTALKSSLFRGGGLDIGQGIPSVLPIENLKKATISTGISEEELNQKVAEINRLKKQLEEKNGMISDLETQLRSAGNPDASAREIKKLQDEINDLKKQIADYEKKLKEAQTLAQNTGGNEELQSKLNAMTAERDELKERLMEYEIIEEDLANLKRLQQENEQLRKTIESLQSGKPDNIAAAVAETAAPTIATASPEPEIEPEPEPEPESEIVPEEIAEPEPKEAASGEPEPVAEEASTADAQAIPEDQKSAEELLSEFEKMLG